MCGGSFFGFWQLKKQVEVMEGSCATVKPENLLSGFVDAETVKKFFFVFFLHVFI